MGKCLLIISATSGNNLILAKNLDSVCSKLKVERDLIILEEYDVPLYTPNQNKNKVLPQLELIMKKFINASGFIICAPEYNGSIPPILTNLIAWMSVMAKNWRQVFNGKIALSATHSGGSGNNLIQSLRIQLNHLGTIVLPRTIIDNGESEFEMKPAKEKIQQLIDLL